MGGDSYYRTPKLDKWRTYRDMAIVFMLVMVLAFLYGSGISWLSAVSVALACGSVAPHFLPRTSEWLAGLDAWKILVVFSVWLVYGKVHSDHGSFFFPLWTSEVAGAVSMVAAAVSYGQMEEPRSRFYEYALIGEVLFFLVCPSVSTAPATSSLRSLVIRTFFLYALLAANIVRIRITRPEKLAAVDRVLLIFQTVWVLFVFENLLLLGGFVQLAYLFYVNISGFNQVIARGATGLLPSYYTRPSVEAADHSPTMSHEPIRIRTSQRKHTQKRRQIVQSERRFAPPEALPPLSPAEEEAEDDNEQPIDDYSFII